MGASCTGISLEIILLDLYQLIRCQAVFNNSMSKIPLAGPGLSVALKKHTLLQEGKHPDRKREEQEDDCCYFLADANLTKPLLWLLFPAFITIIKPVVDMTEPESVLVRIFLQIHL